MSNLLTILKPSTLDENDELSKTVSYTSMWGNYERAQYREQLYALVICIFCAPIIAISVIDTLIYSMFQHTCLTLYALTIFTVCVLSIGLISLGLRYLYCIMLNKMFYWQVSYIINKLGNPDVTLAILTKRVDKMLDDCWR